MGSENEMQNALQVRRDRVLGRLAELIGESEDGAQLSDEQRNAHARRIGEEVESGRITQEPAVTADTLIHPQRGAEDENEHTDRVIHSIPRRAITLGDITFNDPDNILGRYFRPHVGRRED